MEYFKIAAQVMALVFAGLSFFVKDKSEKTNLMVWAVFAQTGAI